MCSCEKDCKIKAAFIIIMLYAASIFIMSIIQLCNEGDYGYKNMISTIKYYTSDQYSLDCYSLLSDLNSKKKFAEAKTIFNLLYNLYLFIYGMQRLNKVEGNCKLGVVFSLILLFGNITELVLTSMSLSYYDSVGYEFDFSNCNYYQSNYNGRYYGDISFWVIELDISIISLTAASVFPIFYLFFVLLCQDCDSYYCVEKEFCWLFVSIGECLGDCCGLCGIFCDGFGKCCDICNGNDDSGLKGQNDQLTVDNNKLRTTLANLEDEISKLRRQKNLGENNIRSEREKLEGEIQQFKNRHDQDLKNEQNLNVDINKMKVNNDDLKKDIEIL